MLRGVLAQDIRLAARVSSLRPTTVNFIMQQVRELQEQGHDLVSLMRGEPDMATPAHIVEACNAALAKGRTGYPDNRGEKNFREAVAQKLQRDQSIAYDPATEILATTGATLGIFAALAALLDEGDHVMLPDPVYDAYVSPVRLFGGQISTVPCPIANGRFQLTADALDRAWSPLCKVLILNTPWNPVGTVLTRDELRAVCDFCLRRNIILLSDEIYEEIIYDGRHHVSPVAAMPEIRDQCVVLNSLSKTYAMTGWRIGYCAAPKRIIDAMLLVLAQASRGPATFVQDAAAAALAGPQDCIAAMRTEYAKRRAVVAEALAGIPGVSILQPEGGFFSMADCRGMNLTSDEIRVRLLKEHGVVVAHGAAYGLAGEGTLRVSFASGGANLEKGLGRLRAGLLAIGA